MLIYSVQQDMNPFIQHPHIRTHADKQLYHAFLHSCM